MVLPTIDDRSHDLILGHEMESDDTVPDGWARSGHNSSLRKFASAAQTVVRIEAFFSGKFTVRSMSNLCFIRYP